MHVIESYDYVYDFDGMKSHSAVFDELWVTLAFCNFHEQQGIK